MSDEENKINEPETAYQSLQMKIYATFSEADEAKYKYLASLSCVEHLQNTIILIKQVYKDKLLELKNKAFKMKI